MGKDAMCNRYRMTAKNIEIAKAFRMDLPFVEEEWPVPELFPKRTGLVLRRHNGKLIGEGMTWGFPPKAGTAPVTNVRNLSSPFWRNALANPDRRCLVRVTDFCEWEGEKGRKVARWFSVHERPIFAFAGIWRPTENGKAFAFLTCDPNPLVSPIHPKAMPVILHPEDYDGWLSGEYDNVCALAAPFPSQLMRVC
jgi:putative SOS response-associated peptidase YedK